MKKVTIYTGPLCNYCDAAKRLLTRNNAPYNEINIATVKGAMDEMAELFAPSPSPGPVAQSVPVYEDEPEQEFAPQQPESGFGKQITGPTGGVTAEVEADDEDLTLNTKAALEGMLDVFAASPAAPACEQRKPAVPCANAAAVPVHLAPAPQQTVQLKQCARRTCRKHHICGITGVRSWTTPVTCLSSSSAWAAVVRMRRP